MAGAIMKVHWKIGYMEIMYVHNIVKLKNDMEEEDNSLIQEKSM